MKTFYYFLVQIVTLLEDLSRLPFALLKNVRKIGHKTNLRKEYKEHSLCILGNGPSLLAFANQKMDNVDVCTVNHCIGTDLFLQIKPKMHLLVDPDFCEHVDREDIRKEYDFIRHNIDW